MAGHTLIELLETRADTLDSKLAFCFLERGGRSEITLSYRELFEQSRTFAAHLQALTVSGDRAVLLYPPGLDYIIAFYGCVLAGVVPVPAYPPRNNHHFSRLKAVIDNSRASVALTSASARENVTQLLNEVPDLRNVRVHMIDPSAHSGAPMWRRPGLAATENAFLQYTSGSTGSPKGVMISHANLMANLQSIQETFGAGRQTRVFSWLPPYHDMGLIGGILGPIFCESSCYLMSPIHFVQQPMRWLEAISKYRIDISGGPNFGYEYCVQRADAAQIANLDLSTWKIAFNGAEPIRYSTLERFAETFAPAGFSADAFHASYGLAESTLLVAFSRPVLSAPGVLESADTPSDKPGGLVGINGFPEGQSVKIVHPDTLAACADGATGEIWLRSASVAQGYWENPEKTRETFKATVAGALDVAYLRTGDLGFLEEGALYVTGRIKDMMIVRGVNLYPHDVENTVASAHLEISPEGVIAFSAEIDGAEAIVVLVEVGKQAAEQLVGARADINRAVVSTFDVQPFAVVFVKRGSLPKTSSGKKERYIACAQYLAGQLQSISVGPADGQAAHTPPTVQPGENGSAPARPKPDSAGASGAPQADAIEAWLSERILRLTGVAKNRLDPEMPFSSLGLDSIKVVQLAGELEQHLGYEVSPTIAYEYSTVRALAAYLAGSRNGAAPIAARPADGLAAPAGANPAAIVGMACRFPGAAGIDEYWTLLCEGRTAISEVPAQRWDSAVYYDESGKRPGSMNSKLGGFIEDVDQFDHGFFDITPREAEQMDPQQRLILQTVWEALEDAGIRPSSLVGKRVGVYVGVSSHDYALMQSSANADNPYATMGNAHSIIANRISYFFDFTGPSLSIDTACSSSLVAAEMACRSLRHHEIDLAIVAGTNLMLAPEISVSFSRAGILAGDGKCKTFDARADGIVRGEGIGVVILKPGTEAMADGNRIYAVIKGGAVNQDGRSNGLTAPNPGAQVKLLEQAYADAAVDPARVSYIEAHGTGTALGDPIECHALARVISERRSMDNPCRIGSVKTNIGHLEAAAGMAGLIKVALALKHGELPASLHYDQPNPHIAFADLKLLVHTKHEKWEANGGPLVGAVSGFGFGGTNAHLVLAQAPSKPSIAALNVDSIDLRGGVLPLSAKSEQSLREQARRFADYFRQAESDIDRVCFSLGKHKDHLPCRVAINFSDRQQLIDELDLFAKGLPSDLARFALRRQPTAAKPVFVFSGQGSQWQGMGTALMSAVPQFGRYLQECDAIIERLAGWSLMEKLGAPADSAALENDIEVVQPAILSIQIALARLVMSWGVQPAAVVGHSMGEVAAAHIAGILNLEDAMRIICKRSELIASTQGQGGTAYVELPLDAASELTAAYGDRVSVAASNGPSSSIISGEPQALRDIERALAERDIFFRYLKVDTAAHCALMDPIRGSLVSSLDGIRPQEGTIPFFSTVLGERMSGLELTADYWGMNLRKPVLFYSAIKMLFDFGCDAFIEVSPHPTLVASLKAAVMTHDVPASVTHVLRRDSELTDFRNCIAALYAAGIDMDWGKIYPGKTFLPGLPRYPWSTSKFWARMRSGDSAGPRPMVGAHALLGARLDIALLPDVATWECEVSAHYPSYMAQHCVDGIPVMPGAAYVEMALAALTCTEPGATLCLTDIEFTSALALTKPRKVQTSITGNLVQVYSFSGKWTEHASMRVCPDGTPPVCELTAAQLHGLCPSEIALDDFYRRAGNNGLQYGAAFRRIRQLRQGTGMAMGLIDVTHDDDAGSYVIPPSVLDCLFQVLGGTIGSDEIGDDLLMPVAIKKLSVAGSLPKEGAVMCLARRTEAGTQDTIAGDLTVFSDDRTFVARIEGLTLKVMASHDLVNDWFYRIDWTALAVPERGRYDSADPRPVAVIDRAGGKFEWVARELGKLGHMAVYAQLDAGDDAWTDRMSRPDIVLDMRAGYACTDTDNLGERVLEINREALGLLGAMQVAWPGPTPVTWFVTLAAQPVGSQDSACFAANASLWGLVKTVSREMTSGDIRLADVGSHDDLLGFIRDVASADGETQVAYRNVKRFVARLVEASDLPHAKPRLHSDGSYLITGGLGGLGIELACWLQQMGARYIVLVGRSAPTAAAGRTIEAMTRAGTRVVTMAADVSRHDEIAKVFDAIGSTMPALRGVFHLAGQLDDGFASQLNTERLRRVLDPKVAGAWNLHLLSRKLELDYFVLFSSASSLVGSPGQASYAAANAFLDTLAYQRRAQHLPALSINWSVWSEIGSAATDHRAGRLARLGVEGITTKKGLDLFGSVLGTDLTSIGIMPINKKAWRKNSPDTRNIPFFGRFFVDTAEGGADNSDFIARYRALEADQKRSFIEAHIRHTLAHALRISDSQVRSEDSLISLGMDSITALEIKNRIQHVTGVALSLIQLLEGATIKRITELISDGLLISELTSQSEQPAAAASEVELEVIDL